MEPPAPSLDANPSAAKSSEPVTPGEASESSQREGSPGRSGEAVDPGHSRRPRSPTFLTA